MKPLTPKKCRVLEIISEWLATHPYAPSLQEVAAILHCATPTIHEHVHDLMEAGYIAADPGHARTIRLTPAAVVLLGKTAKRQKGT